MRTENPEIKLLSVGGAGYSIALPNWETDYIQRKIADSGEPYELTMLRSMVGRLSEGDVVLDVGANIGVLQKAKQQLNALKPTYRAHMSSTQQKLSSRAVTAEQKYQEANDHIETLRTTVADSKKSERALHERTGALQRLFAVAQYRCSI